MNNWIKLSALVLASACLNTSAQAQQPEKKITKSEEIIIRKKGENKEKMTIVVDGDAITINGKPLAEFKNGNVTIMRRDGATGLAAPRIRAAIAPSGGMRMMEEFEGMDNHKAMLGVVTEENTDGAKITSVSKGSAADKAGLKEGDVITKVEGTNINNHDDLVKAISKHKPNDKVDIHYKREGKENKLSATLAENERRAFAFKFREGDVNIDMPPLDIPMPPNMNFNWNRKPKIGLQIQDLEEGKGVQVKDVDDESPALKAGMKTGDIITQVNGKEVNGVDDLREQIKDVKEGDELKVSYKRDGKNLSAQIKLPKRLKSANL